MAKVRAVRCAPSSILPGCLALRLARDVVPSGKSLVALQPFPVTRVHRVIPELLSLLEEYFAEIGVLLQDSAKDLERLLADPRAGCWIANCADVPAGCVLLRPVHDLSGAAECKRLYVRSAFRGQGLARVLLDAMEAFAADAGWKSIYLDSKDDLQAAVAIYRARGYEPCDRYNSNPQATMFFRKMLF